MPLCVSLTWALRCSQKSRNRSRLFSPSLLSYQWVIDCSVFDLPNVSHILVLDCVLSKADSETSIWVQGIYWGVYISQEAPWGSREMRWEGRKPIKGVSISSLAVESLRNHVEPTNDKEELSRQWQGSWGIYLPNLPPLLVRGCPFRGRKLPFWVFDWDPCNKKHINKRKLNKSLLTHILHIYMGITQRATQRSGLEFKRKYHLNRGRSGCTYVS